MIPRIRDDAVRDHSANMVHEEECDSDELHDARE